MGTIPGADVDVKEPDEYDDFHPLDPKISSPLVAWLASDEAGHVSGQVLRAIGETIVLIDGWRYGPDPPQRRPPLGRHHARPPDRDGRVPLPGTRAAAGPG